MISFNLSVSHEILLTLAARAKTKRLDLNLSQQTLSERSGVSYGVLKKFERTGQISLASLLKLALSLGCLNDFEHLFALANPEAVMTLDKLIDGVPRQRGRK